MAGLFDSGIIQQLHGQDSAMPWLIGQASSTAPQVDLSGIPTAVGQQYPRLGEILQNATIGYGTPQPGREGDFLEAYPPWETENPTPGKLNLQIYDRSVQGQALNDMIAADTLHLLGAIDPSTGKPVDPTWYSMKQQFLQTLTPEQQAINQRAFARDQSAQPDSKRSYEDWMQESRLDAYLRAGIFPQINPDWQGMLTPAQMKQIGQMKQYLQKPIKQNQGQTDSQSGETKMAGELRGFGGEGGDQTGSARPGMPSLPWMKLQGLDPSTHGYDFPADVPVMRMKRTYPQTPANEASIPPNLTALLSKLV